MRLPWLITALLLAAGAASAQSPAGDWDDAIDVQDRFRTFHVHVPSTYDAARPAPLVLAFHGRGGSGKGMVALTGFNRLADARGFIVVYPDGVNGSWNDGRPAMPATAQGVDDVEFVRQLLGELRGRLNVDPHRIYATGMSNGGVFAQRLAGALAPTIAAVAPVAGLLDRAVPLPSALPAPVSVILVHGTSDPVVPWGGGAVGSGLSATATAAAWAALNGCPGAARASVEPERAPRDGTRVRREVWAPCRHGSEVILYAIEGGGHTWPGGPTLAPNFGHTSRQLDASAAIVDFLLRHGRRTP